MIEDLTVHGDVGDTQIDVGGKPAVELYLTATVCRPSRPRREIGEIELEGFAEFVHAFPQEQENRDVGLAGCPAVWKWHQSAPIPQTEEAR